MEPGFCRSFRDSLVAFLGEQIEVTTVNDQCVITLPIKTLDDRYIDVFVERKLGNTTLVHDGGKSIAELFAQGIHLTDSQHVEMKLAARRHGVSYQNGAFQYVATSMADIDAAILAVAQCAALAMLPVATHEPTIEDEPLAARVDQRCNTCGAANYQACGCYDRCTCGHDRRTHLTGVCCFIPCGCRGFRSPTEPPA